MRVKLLEPIEGYEDVAEYKYPTNGQPVLREHGSVDVFDRAIHNFCCCLVLTLIKRWRPATIDDAVRAIKGENIEVRFSNNGVEWLNGYLQGYRKESDYMWLSRTREYRYCEVLDA